MVQKRTKTHKLVDITKEIIDEKLCEPCDSKNKSINATYVCDDCDENLCEACKKFHMLEKRNKNHKMRSLVQQLFCETCSAQGSDIVAVFYCLDCEEPAPYCESCAEQHTSMKKSRSHKMSTDLTPVIAQ
jgi:hypothetical protein